MMCPFWMDQHHILFYFIFHFTHQRGLKGCKYIFHTRVYYVLDFFKGGAILVIRGLVIFDSIGLTLDREKSALFCMISFYDERQRVRKSGECFRIEELNSEKSGNRMDACTGTADLGWGHWAVCMHTNK